MPEDEPEVFANYIQLIYTGSIPISGELKVVNTTCATKEAGSEAGQDIELTAFRHVVGEQTMLGKMYVLCEKIQDLQAKNSIRIAMLDSVNQARSNESSYYPHLNVIKEVYAGTLPGDQMRILLANIGVSCGYSEWFPNSETSDYHPDYLLDVVKGMWNRRGLPDNKWRREVKNIRAYPCEELENLIPNED